MQTLLRVGLAVLALSQAVGVWSQHFPASFYRWVPTVDMTPPYSEHFVRDFGGATSATAVVLGVAALSLQRQLVTVALLAYLAFSLPHADFHLANLGVGLLPAVTLTAGLSSSVVLPVMLLICAARTLPAVRVGAGGGLRGDNR